MLENEPLRLHPTNAGGDRGPMVWKFSGKDVLIFGASLMVGLVIYIVLGVLNWSFAMTIFGASTVPLATMAVLLALVSKPQGFIYHWLAWQWMKCRGQSLFEPKQDQEDRHGF